MFGVPLDGSSDVMCDKHRVVNNTSLPQYNLVKKHNVVNYHVLCEAAAAGILRIEKEYMETNLIDTMKQTLECQQRHKLLQFVYIRSKFGKGISKPLGLWFLRYGSQARGSMNKGLLGIPVENLVICGPVENPVMV